MRKIFKIVMMLIAFLQPLALLAYRDRPADLDDYCPGPFEGVSGFIMLVIFALLAVGTIVGFISNIFKGK